MPTILKFVDLEIWQLARLQTHDFNWRVNHTSWAKEFALRNQMYASSGSAMEKIAEGFERSGNLAFKNFLLTAKGSNGAYRSQLYRGPDRKYIIQKTLMSALPKTGAWKARSCHSSTIFSTQPVKNRAANQRTLPLTPGLQTKTI